MSDSVQVLAPERREQAPARPAARFPDETTGLLKLITPLASPRVAGLVAFVIYLLRAFLSRGGVRHTGSAYFNYLADAFLHGQTYLRLPTENIIDLVNYGGHLYFYWPPFPAILVMPLVALFGVGVSDVAYTIVLGAVVIALIAKLLATLDETGIAPLSVERRAIVVATCAFGTVLLILAPTAGGWYSAQIIGLGCVLLAALAAIRLRGLPCYLLVGLALACATGTRVTLVFNGLWLAYLMLSRDWHQPLRRRLVAATVGLFPVGITLLLLGWYDFARFGNPFETGLTWQIIIEPALSDFRRWGQFNLHYIPRNLYYHFVGYTLFSDARWKGGGLFWMTPVLLGAPYALWRARAKLLTWALALSCAVMYIPIVTYMSPGGLTFGPRYLLDMMVPLLVLTALGIRAWRRDVLQVLMIISWATYILGSILWRLSVVWW
jgi:hypothetical protein